MSAEAPGGGHDEVGVVDPGLAPIWRRGAARVLDTMLFQGPLALLLVRSTTVDPDTGEVLSIDLPVWVSAAVLAAAVLYEVVMTAWRGQTLGKMALAIHVEQVGTDAPPTWSRSGVRALLPALLFLLPQPLGTFAGIGVYLSAMTDALRRGFHDRAADTIVCSDDRAATS